MKKIFTYIWLLAGLMACSNEDNISNEQQPAAQAQVYHVCIPASMGDGSQTRAVTFDNSSNPPTCTSTFATTEKVYVYNKSKSTMLTGYLSPSNLSNENKNCDLTGDLTGTFSEGDELWLLYNSDSGGNFSYTGQNGQQTGVKDGAKAVVTVSATSPFTTSFAHFTNLQSMFRFKFEDESSNPITVSYLILFTAKNYICQSYNGKNISSSPGKIYVTPSPATSDYLYLGLYFLNGQTSNDKMIFIAYSNTNLYRAIKSEPSGGFQHGKYYYSTNPIQMTNAGALQTPNITWNTPSSPVAPGSNYSYLINTDNADISLSGTDMGYYLHFNNNATVHLNNLTSTRFEQAIINSAKNLTLDITGTNSFSCLDYDCCVKSYQTLKLQGNGTLTVRSSKPANCGLSGSTNYTTSNNSYTTTTELDVSTQLAATGYTVTRSARTDNPDGTYTWTYTVAGPPVGAINGKFTINASGGQVYFSQGNLQATTTNLGTNWTWHFAANQWDRIGGRRTEYESGQTGNNYINGNGTMSSNGTVDLFGWSTANTYYGISNSKTTNDYKGDFVDWGTLAITNGGNTANSGWRTLTKDEWIWVLGPRSNPAPGTDCRTSSTIGGTENARWLKATVHSVKGLIIFPDAFTWDATSMGTAPTTCNTEGDNFTLVLTDDQWTAIESAGAVFLPFAGYRTTNSDTKTYVNGLNFNGYYWSSTVDSPMGTYFYIVFDSDIVNPGNSNWGETGYSVRLVHDAN